MMTQRFILLLVAALLTIGTTLSASERLYTLKILRGSKLITELQAEIATTPSEQAKGLMLRRSLPEGRGMWFIFDSETQGPFWMKNTYVNLDIIFADNDTKIVFIHKDAKPLSTKSIYPKVPYKYVLEVPAGFAEKYGLKTGDKIRMLATN